MKPLVLALGLAAMPVSAHEGHSPFDDPGSLWQLIEIDGKPFKAKALLEFPEIGRMAGRAPCNRFSASLWSAYPWFQPGPIAATRSACPDLAEESRFLEALGRMTLAEADGDILILTGDSRDSMVFTRLVSGE
ncbi:MAG: META domain-containing protein [Paracoccaceae bacterium]